MRLKEITVTDIEVGDDRLRTVDQDWVEVLCGSIDEFGLKQPIEVREVEGGYRLVAGAHRLAAFVAMDEVKNFQEAESDEYKVVPAIVLTAKTDHEAAEFRVHEITENIIRRNLTVLHHAAHLAELKDAYETLHPETKHGGDRKANDQVAKLATRFSTDAANKTGLSERAIRRAVKIHHGIGPIIRERVDGTWLDDHQSGLETLAGLGPKLQKKICDILFEGKPYPASNMPDAIYILEHGKPQGAREDRIEKAIKVFKALKDNELDQLFATYEARFLEWQKRRDQD